MSKVVAEAAYGDGVCTSRERLTTHIGEETGDLVLIDLVELRPTVLASVEYVLSQQLLGDLSLGTSSDWLALAINIHLALIGCCCLRLSS